MPFDISVLRASIMKHEGCRLHPYKDTVGKLTIGYGRNLTDDGLSVSEAQLLLSNDIQSAIRKAQTQDWWGSVSNNSARARAMVELVYNIGPGGVATFKNAIACLNAGDYDGAAENFLRSRWAQQVGDRAKELTDMIRDGDDAQDYAGC